MELNEHQIRVREAWVSWMCEKVGEEWVVQALEHPRFLRIVNAACSKESVGVLSLLGLVLIYAKDCDIRFEGLSDDEVVDLIDSVSSALSEEVGDMVGFFNCLN